MPIGKNAIKRVENNGYSKVASSAPDMENSSVIANLDEQVMEKLVAPVEKKTNARKAPAKNKAQAVEKSVEETPVAEEKAPAKRKAAKKPACKKAKEGFQRVEVGQQMPYYLL